jgi:hypothetical protein
MPLKRKRKYTFINTKNLFIITLLVMALTITGVYFWGLGRHHTFFANSLITTTVLSVSFFLFISTGLYKGLKLKDDLGLITDKVKIQKVADLPDWVSASSLDFDLDGGDEGCLGVLLAFVLWILAAIALALFVWIFGNLLIFGTAGFMGMLYWIFFRALRLVFKHSGTCKSNLAGSVKIGLFYTLLYNFWIYGIFILIRYLQQ